MKKFFKIFLIVLSVCGSTPASAQSYFDGQWSYSYSETAPAEMTLSAGRGFFLQIFTFSETNTNCGIEDGHYFDFYEVLSENAMINTSDDFSGDQIKWLISKQCGHNYMRICIVNRYREEACNTFEEIDWIHLYD